MRIFAYIVLGSVALLGCGDGGGDTSTGGGGSGGTTASGGGGSGGTTASGGGGTTASGGGGSGGSTSTGGGGSGGSGSVAEGQPCGQSANGALCQSGLVCCYPCGIPDCEFLCTTPCEAGTPGCEGGCLLLP